ncbi:MAG: hypothetical protein H7Y38_05410 [Armatimonadetes bacterium]|nr:hypothetical protein [Armatimonadota bacterium]
MLNLHAARTAAALVAVAAFAGIARADLKIEQTVTVTGENAAELPAGKAAKPQVSKVFTYYKGDKQRVETADSIMLYDGATDTTLYLNPKTKTYFEQVGQAAAVENKMMDMVKFSGEATVTETGEEKVIAGKPARHYKYSINLTLSPKDANAPAALASFLPSQIITGDLWTTDIPGADLAKRQRSTAILKALPPGSAEGLKPVVDKMGSIKGISLDGTQTARTIYSAAALAQSGETTSPPPLVTQTQTTRISEDALPDSYFSLPNGYKKVDPPKRP